MLIRVDHLPDDGLSLVADATEGWACEAAARGADAEVRALDVQLHVLPLRGLPGGIRVRGKARVEVETDCHRCGARIRLRLSGPIDLVYVRAPSAEELDEYTHLDADELDLGYYQDGHLDAAMVLEEQVALWLPSRVRCTDHGVARLEPGECRMPAQHEGPDLVRHNPFADFVLPE